MTRWAPDAALRLEQAAVELFAEQGFAATTVPQIAERAGLTTRTFFRHFADKRDALFLREREFPDVVRSALEALPTGLSGAALMERGLDEAASRLEVWREAIAARRMIIRSEAQLRERELMKSAQLAGAAEEALVERGFDEGDARRLGAFAALIFDLSFDDWLDGPETGTLASAVARNWASLRRLIG
jgi:AcrR family transcriptional regulator